MARATTEKTSTGGVFFTDFYVTERIQSAGMAPSENAVYLDDAL